MIGAHGNTSPVASLRQAFIQLNRRIGALERNRVRAIRGIDEDNTQKNLTGSEVTTGTLSLTIPSTWSSGWSFEMMAMQVVRDKGTAAANRNCTVRLYYNNAIQYAYIGQAMMGGNERIALPATWMSQGLTLTGSVPFECTLQLFTNDDYEVQDWILWVRAERDA